MTSHRPIRVLWVVPSMAGGGAERAAATILSHLDPQRIQSHLCLFRREGPFLEEIPDHVSIMSAPVGHRLNPKLILWLRHCIQNIKPDITIAVLRYCGLVTTIAHLLNGRPGQLILNEQSYPSQEMHLHGNYSFKRWVMKRVYQKVDCILAISKGIREDLITNFDVRRECVSVISNPVSKNQVLELAQGPPPHPWLTNNPVIMSVGRLQPEKGPDLVLRAFARIHVANPSTRLIFVGDGAMRIWLENEAVQLGIEQKVAFAGFQKNPYLYMNHANVIVAASRYEGFGIVLAEALTLGVPVVATNCPGGVAEVLAGGQAGLLVPSEDVQALATGMQQMINDAEMRQKYVSHGLKQANQYTAQNIAAQYTALFEQIIN